MLGMPAMAVMIWHAGDRGKGVVAAWQGWCGGCGLLVCALARSALVGLGHSGTRSCVEDREEGAGGG